MNDQSFKAAAIARISSLESEKLFLDKLYCNLTNQVKLIGKRIQMIDIQIMAEKESVKDIK